LADSTLGESFESPSPGIGRGFCGGCRVAGGRQGPGREPKIASFPAFNTVLRPTSAPGGIGRSPVGSGFSGGRRGFRRSPGGIGRIKAGRTEIAGYQPRNRGIGGARRSAVGARRLAVGARRSAGGARRSAVGARARTGEPDARPSERGARTGERGARTGSAGLGRGSAGLGRGSAGLGRGSAGSNGGAPGSAESRLIELKMLIISPKPGESTLTSLAESRRSRRRGDRSRGFGTVAEHLDGREASPKMIEQGAAPSASRRGVQRKTNLGETPQGRGGTA